MPTSRSQVTAREKAEEKWLLIRTKGAATPGKSAVMGLPEKVNVDLLRKFQDTSMDNIVPGIISALSGLWLLVQVPEIFVPILMTKKSESIPCLFMRSVFLR